MIKNPIKEQTKNKIHKISDEIRILRTYKYRLLDKLKELEKPERKLNFNNFIILSNLFIYGLILPIITGIFGILGVVFLLQFIKSYILLIFPIVTSIIITFYVTVTEIYKLKQLNKNEMPDMQNKVR